MTRYFKCFITRPTPLRDVSRFRTVAVLLAMSLGLLGCANHGTVAGRQLADTRVALGDSGIRSDDEALARQAVRALLDGDYGQANALINQALQLRIDKSYYHLINGLSYHMRALHGDRGAYDLAEQGYGRAIEFDRTNWLAFYFRGRLRIELGQVAAAMQDLAEVLTFQPDDTDALSAFAYASYRSGRPDLAAGAYAKIRDSAKPVAPVVWRNAAITMAALNDGAQANAYLTLYSGTGGMSKEGALLRRRMDDWKSFYNAPMMTPVQYNEPNFKGNPYGNNSTPSANANGFANGSSTLSTAEHTTASGTEDKMVVIDVVMISTEDTITTGKGINLLSGLSIEFGNTTNGVASAGYSFFQQLTNAGAATTTITRAITVPAVNYTLNILNAQNQRSEVLSRPTLVGLAGKQSEFFSGNELTAAAVAGGSSGSNNTILGGQAINIQKEIGVRLGVVPVFLEDGRLKLAVNIERTFLETPSQDVNFTFKLETSKDNINANVIMRYGETLILGGLSEKETQIQRDGVPGLQDVPGLQYLFSNGTTSDYQKSLLVLLTPRPPQYVYQPDKAREAYEKSLSEDERPIANLTARYSDWFRPYPNWASVFHHLQENGLYREFRTGDVDLESWSSMVSLSDRLNQALDFLHY